MHNIKVYVADDHTLFRTAFVRLLHDCKKVGQIKEASNGKELLALVEKEIPDVAIIDIEMPILGGIKTCEKLAELYPEVKIIVLSMHEEKLTICQALQYGALAFLTKVASLEEFESALDAVMSGKPYTNALMQEALRYAETLNRNKCDVIQTKIDFSEREKTIIALICKEFTNRHIALELNISEHTVRNHKVRIMRRAGVKNIQGLVRFAVESGLIDFRQD
jgi:two-component system, NarL family, response regulator DegU